MFFKEFSPSLSFTLINGACTREYGIVSFVSVVRKVTFMKLIHSVVLALGIAIGGWFVGNGIITFRKMDQVVEVRGLDERIVAANEATLDLRFAVTAATIKELSPQVEANQKAIEEFLVAQGVPVKSIQRVPVVILDNAQNRTSYEANQMGRYTARTGVQIFTNEVAKVQDLSQKSDQLLAKGVILETVHPKYTFTDLNTLKPAMLVTATKGAREAAESFARDSGAKLGGIKSASQGLFTISAPGLDYDDAGTVQKRVRVVTRVSYYME
jgi:hypothetical protein